MSKTGYSRAERMTYNRPKPVLRQIITDMQSKAESNPVEVLTLVNRAWAVPTLEFRLLAASLLGLIHVEPPEIVLKTIEVWCESQMNDRMMAIVMNTGLARLRQQAPEKVIEQIHIWLETNDLYYQQVGLRALISILSTGEYENLPFFFHVLSPFVRNAPLKIRPDILEALQILASHSPKETAYFLGQNLKAPDNPDTAALRRKCLPTCCSRQIFSGCMPFLYIVIVSMLVVYIWPQTVLWLPKAIYGN